MLIFCYRIDDFKYKNVMNGKSIGMIRNQLLIYLLELTITQNHVKILMGHSFLVVFIRYAWIHSIIFIYFAIWGYTCWGWSQHWFNKNKFRIDLSSLVVWLPWNLLSLRFNKQILFAFPSFFTSLLCCSHISFRLFPQLSFKPFSIYQ